METLLRQQGKVAISGYGEEWDCLEWQRYEKKDVHVPIEGGEHKGRTEVLWCNYDAAEHGSAYYDSMSIADQYDKKSGLGPAESSMPSLFD